MFRIFWKIWLKVFGWKFVGTFPQELKKCVIAVAPHTSNWDVVVGMATRSVMPIRGAKFLGKQELFRGILGPFMRWIGGVPVDRSRKSNTVEQVAEACRRSDRFILAIAPEGTRKRVDSLKTGFWHMAKAAGIPIVLAGLDYKNKAVVFSEPFHPGVEADDFRRIYAFFTRIEGKHPALGLGHLTGHAN